MGIAELYSDSLCSDFMFILVKQIWCYRRVVGSVAVVTITLVNVIVVGISQELCGREEIYGFLREARTMVSV